jgi:hypothetical protein
VHIVQRAAHGGDGSASRGHADVRWQQLHDDHGNIPVAKHGKFTIFKDPTGAILAMWQTAAKT